MIKISKKELSKKIVQALIRVIKCTLGLITLYNLDFTRMLYKFMK